MFFILTLLFCIGAIMETKANLSSHHKLIRSMVRDIDLGSNFLGTFRKDFFHHHQHEEELSAERIAGKLASIVLEKHALLSVPHHQEDRHYMEFQDNKNKDMVESN